MYTLRDKNGFLIAHVSDYITKSIILKSRGHFQDKILDGIRHKCYVLEENGWFVFGDGKNDPEYFRIYLWKDNYFYEE